MAKFTDLANELILMIASHIPASADKLHLLLVNSELCNMLKPIFYKCIVLDQGRDPSVRVHSTLIDGYSCWDAIRLRHLCNFLEKKKHAPASDKPVIESLCLELDSTTFHESFTFSSIMECLPTLKHLCFCSKRPTRHGVKQHKWSPISLKWMKAGLRGVRGSLESLIIDIDQDISLQEGSSIGFFINFKALKYLSIQSHVLLGEEIDHLYVDQNYGTPKSYPDRTILASYFPHSLQSLQISCLRALPEEEGGQDWGLVIALLLEDMMKWGLDDLPELRDITVYYQAKGRVHYGVDDDLADEEVEEDEDQEDEEEEGEEEEEEGDGEEEEEDDDDEDKEDEEEDEEEREELKPKCKKHALKGQWQEVARTLMEAAPANQPVSVKYVQAPQQKGSSSSSSPLFEKERRICHSGR